MILVLEAMVACLSTKLLHGNRQRLVQCRPTNEEGEPGPGSTRVSIIQRAKRTTSFVKSLKGM
jgi:hypothetical protein